MTDVILETERLQDTIVKHYRGEVMLHLIYCIRKQHDIISTSERQEQ